MQIWMSGRVHLLCICLAILSLGLFRFAQAVCVPPGGCSVALAYYVFNSTYDGNLTSVANRFQARESDILSYSQLNSTTELQTGQGLRIPFVCGCGGTALGHNFSYSVVSKDLGSTIAAQRYGFLTTVTAIQTANNEDLNSIYPQNILLIPVNCFCGDPNVNSSYGLFLTYVAEDNDNEAVLSKKFNIPTQVLQSYNQQFNLDLLQPSVDILFVPAKDGNGSYPPFNSTGLGSSNSNTKTIVGASVGAAVFLLAVIGAVLFYVCIYRPRRHREGTEMVKYQSPAAPRGAAGSSEAARLFSEGSGYSNTTTGTLSSGLSYFSPDRSVEFTYKELSDATNNFSIAKKIGQGGYGSVFYGEIHGQVEASYQDDEYDTCPYKLGPPCWLLYT